MGQQLRNKTGKNPGKNNLWGKIIPGEKSLGKK